MSILEFNQYRDVIKAQIAAQTKARGELQRLAQHLRIHTTTLSQILKGQRQLSPDQAVLLSEHFGFSHLETRYFHLLVQLDRADHEKLRAFLKVQIAEILEQAQDLKSVLKADSAISEEDKASFYSNWFYSAIRVLSSIPRYQTRESIGDRLGLNRKLVNEVVQFLLSRGLCKETNGVIEPGPQYTHLAASSPLISRHHGNWRVRAMEHHPRMSTEDLAYSSPMSLSRSDIKKVRAKLVKWIEDIHEVRKDSEAEEAVFLNIDWIKM